MALATFTGTCMWMFIRGTFMAPPPTPVMDDTAPATVQSAIPLFTFFTVYFCLGGSAVGSSYSKVMGSPSSCSTVSFSGDTAILNPLYSMTQENITSRTVLSR